MEKQTNTSRLASSNRALLLGIFVLSGFAGLIYQSIWSQYLGIFLGHAAYAQALVLAIFMGGMAAGSMWISHIGEKWRNLVRCYALIEGLIGILGLLFHFIFTTAVDFSYNVLIPATASPWLADVVRWLVAAILILPQTILLGMTFPLMSGGLIRRFPGQDGSLLGGLYFTNSIGAAFGALLAAFVLLPSLGLPGTVVTAGFLNLIVAGLAWWLARNPEPAPKHSADSATSPVLHPLLRVVLASTAISGAASFVYEIVWIRMLSMAVGSTLHAFELMLTSFIAGIAFGGLWVRKRADSNSNPLRLAGWMQVGMGLAALFSLVVYSHAFDWVGWLMGALDKTPGGYVLYSSGTAVISILIMLPAAFFAGTTLPLFTVTLLRSGHGERVIGQVYAWNTVGSIVGVFAAMHLLIPVLGLKLALVAAAFVDMGIGLLLLRKETQSKLQMLRTAVAAFAVVLATGLSITKVQFDPLKLASGVFRTGNVVLQDGRVLFYRDGKTASISVVERHGGKSIAIATNGKPDAGIVMQGTPSPDEPTMILAAALPLSMHNKPEEIGVIGFGSGMTTHTFLGDPRVKRVDTIEIEPAMVEGAKLFGGHVSRAYTDPRSNIIIDDAKAYFSGQQARYDIIISEPSNPWISGVGSLFSQEFYQFVPRHLKQDGLFVQWVQLYEIDDKLVSSIINAFTPAFSDYRAYISNSSDLIIVATPTGNLPEMKAEFILQGLIGADLKHQGITKMEQLQLRQVADARLLRAHGTLFGMQPNSYYHPILSLRAPQTRFTNSIATYLTTLSTQTSVLPAMMLDALGIRQALPENIEAISWSYDGESSTALARRYAAVLRGDVLSENQIQQIPDSVVSSAYLLRQTAIQACNRPHSLSASKLLSANLRQATEQILIALPPSMQKEIFTDPVWLPCQPTHISADFAHIMRLNAAIGERNWPLAAELGEQWLRKTDADPDLKEQFDDIALISVMLTHARQGKWQEMQNAEKQLSGNMTAQTASSYMVISLLLAMADTESNLSTSTRYTK
ncbi:MULTISPECIES: fused MFS/spermidine synthase [unclassified Eikenella]|uniref:fused MFS/spermidine synthase n=1 Tax=unclassified Eikenella TaxID=2639367 RepID=UPI0008A19779|nr:MULTISPECIES: fused MFS/spermidine synthase [unclassified Eikenella]OFK86137.1 spermidine synthase [Eikenella sp. HMSC071B05]OFO43987.1 spermidine synthase [Eikenella sp. HMSC073A11]